MKIFSLKILRIIWKAITFIPKIIFDVIYNPIARKRSWKRLPKVANKLGLKFIKSKYSSELGKFSGIIEGYKVEVEPDENGKIIIFFNSKKEIKLWTDKNSELPKNNMYKFKTTNWNFNSIFKTRQADKHCIDYFKNTPELIDHCVHFYIKWMWSLNSIYISEVAIYCEMTYGQPFFPYIPASSLEIILNDIIELAEYFDSIK